LNFIDFDIIIYHKNNQVTFPNFLLMVHLNSQ